MAFVKAVFELSEMLLLFEMLSTDKPLLTAAPDITSAFATNDPPSKPSLFSR